MNKKLFLGLILLLTVNAYSQRQEYVDFHRADAIIFPNPDLKEIKGKVSYEFEIKEELDSIFLDAFNMTFLNVKLNRKKIKFYNSGKKLFFKAPKKVGHHTLELEYKAIPKQTVYFIKWEIHQAIYDLINSSLSSSNLAMVNKSPAQIWTQGQGKYTSHWLPSLDDMNDKIEFDFTFISEWPFEVISNGEMIKDAIKEDYHRYNMNRPMSSYLAAFVIGNFDKKELYSKSGVPIELYYEPKDSSNFEPTYRYTKEIFDFFEEEIGVPYPWQNYKQVPVQDFLYAGMENTTCTIFSNQYVIDSTAFVDKNYVNVNAHELAHQWFGNLVTEVSGEHHWLHEGFATYYAYLAERALFGDDHYYWKLYETAKTLRNLSENGDGEALTDPNAGSLTFYEKGAWALVILRERVGEEVFKTGIQNYLNNNAYANVTIGDFLKEMELTSEVGLDAFKRQWLDNEEFLWDEVKNYLEQNNSLKTFFTIQESKAISSKGREKDWNSKIWNPSMPDELKRQFVFDYIKTIPDSLISKILNEESLRVRQAIALTMNKVPKVLQVEFESLLSDGSYLTQETALFKLWQAFPEKRSTYLEALDGVEGFPNKSVRQLWLALALLTPEYQPLKSKAFYQELNDYTQSHHNFEVRQLAFQYLFQIQALSDDSLKNLVQACGHHVWQFNKSSRNLIRELNKTDEGKTRLENLRTLLTEEENQLLDVILDL